MRAHRSNRGRPCHCPRQHIHTYAPLDLQRLCSCSMLLWCLRRPRAPVPRDGRCRLSTRGHGLARKILHAPHPCSSCRLWSLEPFKRTTRAVLYHVPVLHTSFPAERRCPDLWSIRSHPMQAHTSLPSHCWHENAIKRPVPGILWRQ